MGKLYKGQTALTIQRTVYEDITGATALIKYRTPSGIEGSWPASITDTENGIIEYQIASAEDILEAGDWTFWADITFPDGTWAAGEPLSEFFYMPGY